MIVRAGPKECDRSATVLAEELRHLELPEEIHSVWLPEKFPGLCCADLRAVSPNGVRGHMTAGLVWIRYGMK